jgi:hypothetical protein
MFSTPPTRASESPVPGPRFSVLIGSDKIVFHLLARSLLRTLLHVDNMASTTDSVSMRPRASTSNSPSALVTPSASATATTRSRPPHRNDMLDTGTTSTSHRPNTTPDSSRQPAGDADTSAPARNYRHHDRVDEDDSDASNIADDDWHLRSVYDLEFVRLFIEAKKVAMAFAPTERIREKSSLNFFVLIDMLTCVEDSVRSRQATLAASILH